MLLHCPTINILLKLAGQSPQAFWSCQLEEELRESELLESAVFNNEEDVDSREKWIQEVDKLRAKSVYPHPHCSDECKSEVCIIPVINY